MKEERQVTPYVLEREIPREISPDMFDPRARDLEDNGFVDVRRLLQILSKRRLLIGLVMLLFCMLAAYRSMSGPPSYVASTVIRIDPTTPEFIKLSDATAPVADSTYYETEYAVLSSAPLAVRVIDTLKLYDDTRFTSQSQIEDPITRLQRTVNQRALELVERVKDQVIGPRAKESKRPSRADAQNGRAFEFVDQYLTDLTIIPDRNSRLVTIRYTSFSPELSAEISRVHAQEFIKMNVEARGNVNTEAQTFLEARLDDVKKRMEASEAALNQFRRDHRVLAVGGNEKENVTLERLSTLNTDYSAAQAERIALEAQYLLVKKRAYGDLASVQRDPLYNELRAQLENLKSEHAKLGQIYQPAYPKMVAIANEIAVTEARLNAQIHSAVAGVESQYLSAKGKEEALAAAVDKERQATLDLNDLNAQFEVVKRDADANRELYNNLLTHVKESDVRETMKTSNVNIVEPARVPAYAVARAGKSFGKALLIGFILGFAVAFVIEYLDDRLQTPDQVEAELHIPALAVIPAFHCELPGTNDRRQRLSMREPIVPDAGEDPRPADEPKRALPMVMRLVSRQHRTPKRGREAGSDALVVVTRRRSLVAEAYRTLRTAMLLSSADRPPQVMQITSAQGREGKTVTSVNTAATLAQSGAKVLLIDADLRRPRCHRVLMTEIAPGLVDCLVGHASFEECVRPIRYQPSPNGANGNGHRADSAALFDGCLDLMTAGTRPPNPAEILGSERMREMLTMARQRYDYILIDTPPVLPVADAVLLSRSVDGVLVVVNGTITPRGLVREAIKRLRRVKAPIMGVALNEVDVVKGDYHYYYRTYYSSYEYGDSRNA